MQYWKVKAKVIPGKTFSDVNKIARKIYHALEKKSKRKAYIRSKYFKKQKVFLSFFWDHLSAKRPKDRLRRLKYFECALEVIRDSTLSPTGRTNPNNRYETFFRFLGQTRGGKFFAVQIKQDKKGTFELMSVFPWE